MARLSSLPTLCDTRQSQEGCLNRDSSGICVKFD